MSNPAKLTYHPIVKWRCEKCGQSGEFHHPPGEPIDVRWNRVLDAHLTGSPDCYEAHGDAGIAVSSETVTLPA